MILEWRRGQSRRRTCGSTVFPFQNGSEVRVLFSNYVPSGFEKKAFVNIIEVFNAQASHGFGLADVIPCSKVEGCRTAFFLVASPPKVSNDGVDFC